MWNGVVQVLLSVPNSRNPNPKLVGEGFGFLFVFGDLRCQTTVFGITPEQTSYSLGKYANFRLDFM